MVEVILRGIAHTAKFIFLFFGLMNKILNKYNHLKINLKGSDY